MVESDAPLPGGMGGAERLALAWALKNYCYAAWSSEPQRAGRCADVLRHRLLQDEPTQSSDEIAALADWTSGIAEVTRGNLAEAVAGFDRAAAAFRALNQANHAALTQVPKIMALTMLGRHPDAAECAERTQQELVVLGDLRAASKVSLNLGSLYLRRDLYADAARHYREAGVFFARIGDHEHSVMADIGIADAHASMGNFDEALLTYARARMRAVNHGFPVLQAMADGAVALLHLARGQFATALAGLETLRRRYDVLGMPQLLVIAEKQLGDAYLELRLLPEALALFDQALARFESLDMPDDQAWTLAQRGRTLALLGQGAGALDSLARAAELFAAQENQVGEAAVTLARAELALVAVDTSAALAFAGRAATGFMSAGMTDSALRADVVCAEALLAAGDIDRARALFDAGLVRARTLELIPAQVRCLTGQGLTAAARGQRDLATKAFDAAVDMFEEQRFVLPGDEIRSAFLTDHLRPYRELLRLALAEHARSGGQEAATTVLQRLDRFRASVLGERLQRGNVSTDDAPIRALRARLNWLHRRAQQLHDDGEPSAKLTAELRTGERDLLERVRRQRLTDASAAAEHKDVQVGCVDTDALRNQLGAGEALLEYGVLDEELFACVVTREGVTLKRQLARWPDVQDAIRSARFQLETLRNDAAVMANHLPTIAKRTLMRMQRLYALVWAPLTDTLADCSRVLVVPHGQLGLLPFAALHDGNDYLGEVCELAVVPSAAVAIHGLRRQPGVVKRALVLGESSRLPHATSEARFVASLFEHSSAFVGEHATVATVRAHASEADVIHLACHAEYRADNPMFSALHLADGALTVEMVEALRFKPAIVVLSACETGLAEHGTGDEMVGLVRAFLVGGAARVLGSLWPVSDEATAAFMQHFYGALARGQSSAGALRAAQAELMKTHPHPFYWAAFTLYGGW